MRGPIVAVVRDEHGRRDGRDGDLGLHLVPALLAANHQVRVVSRTGKATARPPAEVVTGDVLRTDLRPLFDGADCVVHAATSPSRRAGKTEVEGTRNVISASQQAGVQHLVYVSIVGVDRHRFPYYRAKREAEQVVESSGSSPAGWCRSAPGASSSTSTVWLS